jgi:hypothetical protein
VVCLIDGDGNIFKEDLITLGYAGGKQAAMLLNKGINDSLSGEFTRAKLWVQVYLNQTGLAETLASRNMCTVGEFESFVVGFNQSSPLFSIIDVGSGKEAADAKIKGDTLAKPQILLIIYRILQNVYASLLAFRRPPKSSLEEVRNLAHVFEHTHV